MKKLLIIGFTWPEPLSTAAGTRMQQLIHFFIEQRYEVTFASTANTSTLSMDLASLGVKSQTILLNHDSFDDFVKELQPTIVLFDRFLTEEQFGWRVAEAVPDAVRILETSDLHSLREAREKAFRANEPFTVEAWLQHDTTKREIASIYRCDLSLIISSYEMELLTQTLKIEGGLLLHLPFMLRAIDEAQMATWPGFEERTDFVCIGNGKHAPNVDAIVWLKHEIWPLIRKRLPEAQLHVYGSYLPEQISQMHRPKEGFWVHGWAEDAHAVLRNALVNLAPLRFGAGIKGKLADAMLNGTPSITTAIGAEGMHDGHPWCGGIYSTAEELANAAVQLYTDTNVWRIAVQKGIAIINDLYDTEKLGALLKIRIEGLLKNLKAHRIQNFTGAMIQHQTLQSTKYLSKWIAEKNRGG